LDSDFIISATNIGFGETLPNLIKRKHPRKGQQKKKTRGKDQSLGKQTAQKGQATRKGNP
jgi:hypothetical protein